MGNGGRPELTRTSGAKRELGLAPSNLEVKISEMPKHNWGFRGQTGDEISLKYRVEI